MSPTRSLLKAFEGQGFLAVRTGHCPNSTASKGRLNRGLRDSNLGCRLTVGLFLDRPTKTVEALGHKPSTWKNAKRPTIKHQARTCKKRYSRSTFEPQLTSHHFLLLRSLPRLHQKPLPRKHGRGTPASPDGFGLRASGNLQNLSLTKRKCFQQFEPEQFTLQDTYLYLRTKPVALGAEEGGAKRRKAAPLARKPFFVIIPFMVRAWCHQDACFE